MTQIGVAMQQADVAIWQNSYYIQATYCRLGNFCIKNNSCENFCGVKFSRFVRSAKFFNGWWLRCGWAPGEFLLVLPGIGRARYCWLCIVVVLIFTSGGVDLCAYLSIDHHCASFFFRVFNFRGWPRPRNYFNSKIFPIYGTYSHTMYICTFGMQTMQCQSSVWGLRSSSRSSGVLPSIMWHFAAACHSQVSLSPLDGIFSCNFHDFHDGVHDVKHVRNQHNNLRLFWRVFWYSIRQGR